jgi:hypothetical protein
MRSLRKDILGKQLETSALIVRSVEIPHNWIFPIIRKSLSMLMLIAFDMVINREHR